MFARLFSPRYPALSFIASFHIKLARMWSKKKKIGHRVSTATPLSKTAWEVRGGLGLDVSGPLVQQKEHVWHVMVTDAVTTAP